MNKRDFFRLPVGTYDLTDSINNYQYTLRTKLTDDGERMHIIRIKGSLSASGVCLFEKYVNNDGGVTFYPNDIKYKIISSLLSLGGITIHSDNNFMMLNELRFIPRGSFKEFVKRITFPRLVSGC